MDSKKTIVGGLVILLIAAIIYYFFFRENPKLPTKINGVAAGSLQKDPNVKPTVVYVPTNVAITPTTQKDELGFPVAFLSYAQGVKNLQLMLMKFKDTLPIISNSGGADGVLGNGTINAIKRYYPSVAQNIESKKAMSRNDYDFLMADLRDSNNNVPANPSLPPNLASVGGSTAGSPGEYLRSKGLVPTFNLVFNKIWADAHKNKNNFVYWGVDTALVQYTYSYKTGQRIR